MLPDELLCAVFLRLDCRTLVTVIPKVCVRWRGVCSRFVADIAFDFSPWASKLSMLSRLGGPGCIDRRIATMVRSVGGGSAIRFPAMLVNRRRCGKSFGSKACDSIVAAQDFIGLKRLDLTDATWLPASPSLQLICGMQHLERLDLAGWTTLTDDDRKGMRNLRNLRCLTLKDCDSLTSASIGAHLSRLVSLQHLSLQGCLLMDGIALKSLASLKDLRTIVLSDADAVDDDVVDWLCHELVLLETVDVSNCPNVTSNAMAHFDNLRKLTTLLMGCSVDLSCVDEPQRAWMSRVRHLDVAGCFVVDAFAAALSGTPACALESLDMFSADITSEGLSSISKLTTLKRLGLSDCNAISRWGYATCLPMLGNLERLCLHSSQNLTDECVRAVSGLPNLRVLNIVNCPRLTQKSIDWLTRCTSRELERVCMSTLEKRHATWPPSAVSSFSVSRNGDATIVRPVQCERCSLVTATLMTRDWGCESECLAAGTCVFD